MVRCCFGVVGGCEGGVWFAADGLVAMHAYTTGQTESELYQGDGAHIAGLNSVDIFCLSQANRTYLSDVCFSLLISVPRETHSTGICKVGRLGSLIEWWKFYSVCGSGSESAVLESEQPRTATGAPLKYGLDKLVEITCSAMRKRGANL